MWRFDLARLKRLPAITQASRFCLYWILGIAFVSSSAQAGHDPVLLRREMQRELAQTNAQVEGQPVLPEEASGEYNLDKPGELLQIILDGGGRLTGYLSIEGDRESDRGTPLTFLFRHTRVSREQIAFETVVIHSVWYGFRGAIEHAPEDSKQSFGAYRLTGVLEEHELVSGTVTRRNLDLRLKQAKP